MTIARTLVLAFLAFGAAISVATILAIAPLRRGLDDIGDFHGPALFEIQALQAVVHRAALETVEHAVGGLSGDLEERRAALAEATDRMARFRSVAHLDRPGEEVEAALFRRIEIGVERIAEMGDRVVEAGGAATPERMVPSPDFEATVDDVVAALAELIVHEQDEVAVGQATARAVIRGAERRLWGLGAISLVGASVIGLLLSRRITGPINQLLAAARGVGAGALTRVAVPGSDELAALAGAFNAMVDDVEAARSSLESAVAARTSELEAANVALRESIAERESTEARQRLMMHELDHRVKNTLAAVIALAGQTLAGASTKEEFRIAFEGRLHAMARTHEALARERWKGVDVAEAVRLVLDPYEVLDRSRFTTDGERTVLPSHMVPPFGLVLHELATNAAKHGALSTLDGRVDVHWAPADDGAVNVRWIEHGGPPVVEPTGHGLGLRLVRGLIEHEIGGDVRMRFEPDGFVCEMRLPHRAAREATA